MTSSLPPVAAIGSAAVGSVAPPTTRPTGVTAVSVLCIIGGVLGMLSGLMQIVQLFIGTRFATAFVPAGDAGAAQRQWYAELEAALNKYLVPNVGFAVAGGIVAICLLVGGIGLLRPKAWARTWLRRALLAAIVIDVLHFGLYVLMQIDVHPLMVQQFDVLMPDAGAGNKAGPPPGMLQAIQTFALIIGYVMAAVWLLVKLTLYAWGRYYLNRDPARAYCDGATTRSPPATT